MVEDVGTSWVVWRESAQRRVMISVGDRREAFVADDAAVTIAGALERRDASDDAGLNLLK
jgi:hypothetical protein